jgi:TonB-linked SusC/RagA family outer membrane protein
VDAATQRPLPNATVRLRGTPAQTTTNAQGEYTLSAQVQPGTYTLEYSLIGRGNATRQVTFGATPTVQVGPVRLAAAATQLDELVVTASGVTTERREIGNTVATISGEAVTESPAATSIDQALQGKIAGAVISQNSGQPGGGVSIRLRGTSSILGGAEPLIVVDGVLVENTSEALIGLGANAGRGGAAATNRLSDINPNDVERVEVLKGAAAAALYGSQANNGVIQIFTKRGRQGKPRITFQTEAVARTTPERYQLNMLPLATRGDVLFGPAKTVGEPVERFDIQDDIFRTGYGTQNNLSISGGSEGTTYYLSGSWLDEQGIIRSADYEKASARVKLTQRLSDWLEVTGNANYIRSNTNYVPEGEQTQGVITGLIFTPTSYNPAFDPVTGRYPYSPILGANPFDVLENFRAEANVDRFVGSFQAGLTPLPNLSLTYLFGIDESREENILYQPPFSLNRTYGGLITNPVRSVRRFNNDITASHEAMLSPRMQLTSTAGFRQTFSRNNIVRAAAIGLNPGQTTIGGGGATPSASQGITEIATVGGFLQERVGISDRLFLTGGLNLEGSSAFGEDVRWQLFPRAGVSYSVSDEPFWDATPLGNVFSTFRLRGSYGETGGQPPGAYIRFDSYGNTAHAGFPGLIPGSVAGNPGLKPERQREWEGGFEAGFLNDRASLEFTYYNQRTTDLVLGVPLPLSSGYTTQFRNIGEVSNRGVEVTLSTANVQRSNFGWNSRLTFASNRNRVESLGGAADSLNYGYLNYVIEGQPIGVFYGSVYPRDAQGNIILSDAGIPRRARDENGVLIRKILGDPTPDFTAALSNDFTIGDRTSLSFLLDGRFGNEVANFSRRISEYFGAGAANAREATGEVPANFYTLNLERHLLYEEFVEDGSFVKLREIAFRYRFDQPWVRRLGTDDITLNLAARNLYTWTNYSGIDPEINLFSANTVARGVEFGTTPIPRTLVLGLTFNF